MTLKVSFLNSKKSPAAILELLVSPRYYYIDRTLRFFRSENDSLRKVIKVPQSSMPFRGKDGPVVYDPSKPERRYMRCSHPEVVCSLSETGVMFL